MKEGSLIILDLNGLLIERTYARGKPAKDFNGVIVGDHVVAARPGALKLVDELAKNFKVALWSSMKQYNIDKLLPHVFGERTFFFVWGQERCWRLDGEYIKPLEVVWAQYPTFDATNTLLFDDDQAKFAKNPPECCFATNHPHAVELRVKQKNAAIKGGVFVVTFTEVADDYKNQDVDTSEPAVFSTLESAQDYVSEWLRDWLVERLEDYEPEGIAEEYDIKTNFFEWVRDYAPDDAIREIVETHYVVGEYVNRTLDWTITVAPLDAHRVKKRRKVVIIN